METRLQTLQTRIADALARPLFFIAGTERSGTTWLQLLLDSHPEIACRGEGQFMNRLFPQMTDVFRSYRRDVDAFNRGYFRDTPGFPVLEDDEERYVKQAVLGLLLSKFDPSGAARVLGEKTPGNIRALDRLKYLAPACRIVFIVRDGRDVAVSLWHHGRPDKHERQRDAEMRPFFQRAAQTWAADVRRMQAFQERHGADAHVVRYEDLHEAPDPVLADLFGFLGVAADAQTIAACLDAADFSRFAGGRKRGEEDRSAQFRKGVVGDWRGYDAEGNVDAMFREHAAAEMTALGYGG
jgi:hypothetical protein